MKRIKGLLESESVELIYHNTRISREAFLAHALSPKRTQRAPQLKTGNFKGYAD